MYRDDFSKSNTGITSQMDLSAATSRRYSLAIRAHPYCCAFDPTPLKRRPQRVSGTNPERLAQKHLKLFRGETVRRELLGSNSPEVASDNVDVSGVVFWRHAPITRAIVESSDRCAPAPRRLSKVLSRSDSVLGAPVHIGDNVLGVRIVWQTWNRTFARPHTPRGALLVKGRTDQ